MERGNVDNYCMPIICESFSVFENIADDISLAHWMSGNAWPMGRAEQRQSYMRMVQDLFAVQFPQFGVGRKRRGVTDGQSRHFNRKHLQVFGRDAAANGSDTTANASDADYMKIFAAVDAKPLAEKPPQITIPLTNGTGISNIVDYDPDTLEAVSDELMPETGSAPLITIRSRL